MRRGGGGGCVYITYITGASVATVDVDRRKKKKMKKEKKKEEEKEEERAFDLL